jgi:hypothetical protein
VGGECGRDRRCQKKSLIDVTKTNSGESEWGIKYRKRCRQSGEREVRKEGVGVIIFSALYAPKNPLLPSLSFSVSELVGHCWSMLIGAAVP